jgi:hypothetical protein
MTGQKKQIWQEEKEMLNKDTLLTAILAASGGKQVIKYDDKGKPSVMVRIPKFNLESIDASLGSGPHPAFVVNGVVKNEIYIGAYQAVVDEGRACSLPGVSPTVNINFDNAKAACVNKGPGWHLMTAWEWAAIALWCLKNGTQPRGNTSSGKSHEAVWETGTPAPDNSIKTLSGSGPASWRHDGTYQGIADLVGNVWEWNDGLKTVDGRFYFPLDNNFGLAEESWPASPIYMDASAGPGDRSGASATGTPILSDRITKYSETPTPAGGGDTGDYDYTHISGVAGWRTMGVSTTFDNLPLADRQRATQLLIAPRLASGADLLFSEVKGAVWCRNYGTRFPLRGACWGSGVSAGVGALYVNNLRAYVTGSVGLRPAFVL